MEEEGDMLHGGKREKESLHLGYSSVQHSHVYIVLFKLFIEYSF